MSKNTDYSLYLVTDRDILKGRDLYKATEEAILGGTTIVQLREKFINDEEFLNIARELKKVTDKYNVPLIINDNIYVAKKVDAAGLHIGQSDTALIKAREILGNDKIIGVSVKNLDEVKLAEENGADYLGIGPVFYTGSKKDIDPPIGLDGLREIVNKTILPNVAIGGIHLDNMDNILDTKTNGIAIISEILGQDNIRLASQNLRDILDKN